MNHLGIYVGKRKCIEQRLKIIKENVGWMLCCMIIKIPYFTFWFVKQISFCYTVTLLASSLVSYSLIWQNKHTLQTFALYKKTLFLQPIFVHSLRYLSFCKSFFWAKTDRFLRFPFFHLILEFFLTLIQGRIPLSARHLKTSLLS